MRAEAARLRLIADQMATLITRAGDTPSAMRFEGPFARAVNEDLRRDSRFGLDAASQLREAATTLDRSADQVEAAIIAERRRLAAIAEAERLAALKRSGR